MKRIGIDCRLAGAKHAGIGRYTENLVRECTQHKQFTWVLFFSDLAQAEAVLPDAPSNVELVIAKTQHYSFKEQLTMPRVFQRAQLDLLHVPHFNIPLLYQGKIVITIHDLLWHEQRGSAVTTLPAWQYWLKYWAYRLVVNQAVNRALRIFVPTQTVANTLTRYYPQASKKVTVTPEGISAEYQRALAKKAPSKKPDKTLVYTGSLYPHKNVRLVIQALKKLPEFSLILAGARSVFRTVMEKYVAKQGVEKQVRFAGYLSDKELIAVYQKSYALVFPSLSEGFGLPGLEAMAAGLPVIAADIPVFKEVYGEAAAYFDPKSVDELVETIRVLEPSRTDLIKAGRQQATRFDWHSMAEKTMRGYQTALEK